MAARKLLASLVTVLIVTCAMFSTAQCASVEALYNEINKLPAQQRQKRLEDGARKEGAF